MLSERFANKIDRTKFQMKVYSKYVEERQKKQDEKYSDEEIQLNEDIVIELNKIAKKLNCTLNDLVNIILKEKIIEIEGRDLGFDESMSTICLQELLIAAENNEDLEDEIFKEKVLIVDSMDFTKKVVLLPINEYEKLNSMF